MQTLRPTAKPAKQRRMIYQAPDHIRRKLFAAPLSAELQASHGTKTIPVRNGDTVRIMRGDHKGFEGKVSRIDRTNYRIYVEGLTREKVDGTAIFVPVHPSKVKITGLVLDDKWRKSIVDRKKQARKAVRKAKAKGPEEIVESKELAKEEVAKKEETPPKKLRPRKPSGERKIVTEKSLEQKPEKEKEKAGAKARSKAKRQRTTRKRDKETGGA
jgi:large subunit ribosomal protein L24